MQGGQVGELLLGWLDPGRHGVCGAMPPEQKLPGAQGLQALASKPLAFPEEIPLLIHVPGEHVAAVGWTQAVGQVWPAGQGSQTPRVGTAKRPSVL